MRLGSPANRAPIIRETVSDVDVSRFCRFYVFSVCVFYLVRQITAVCNIHPFGRAYVILCILTVVVRGIFDSERLVLLALGILSLE